jgi:filamentous hemagglutinin family protein
LDFIMNRSYRSIWNDSTGTFVAVSENASSAGKKTSSGVNVAGISTGFALQALAVSVMFTFGANALAQPTGGVVAAGAASISSAAGNTTINQSTQNAVINWQSFNIAAGQSVQFVQPGKSSVALNRVLGADPSNILGSLSANGQVFLVNPNGVLFGKGAQVNVGGLVASSLNIADGDFMAGNYKFGGAGSGAVRNDGTINADGGYVALLGAKVGNDGVIAAQLGTVALAAGNAITLDVAGDGLLNVSVSQGAVNALVQNGGLIQADGGRVLLTAQSASSLLQSAVNNSGVVRAQTLVTGENGSIMLMGDMESGTVNVGGTLDASAPNSGNGGFIETSAAHVKVADNAKITTLASTGKTGTWLIDPMDYTVAVGGGDITGTQLGTNLDATSIIIKSVEGTAGTLGNVNVNDAVSWTAPTTLTLQAVNDVNINAAISGINGSLDARAGNNVNVAAATKTTTGNLSFTAVNDVLISAATTITTGNLTAVAGRNVTLAAASTVTTGDMILRADNDGTGPGSAAGTVAINCGSNCLTITTGNLSIRFNPVSYATTGSEILAYDTSLTGAGVLDAKAWVFGKGENKIYDNTRAATVSGLKPDLTGVVPAVTLGAVSNALFDTEHVGANKPIIYNSTFSDAVHDLFAPVGFTPGTYQTRGDILVRPLTVNAVTDSRVYNGTTSSVGVPTVVDLQAGDTLSGQLTQNYASKDVLGIGGSTLVANGPYTVADGNGGNNYTVTVNTAPGTITPAPLTLQANDATKVYGTTFTPAGTAFTTPVAPVNGETVTSVVETSTGSPPAASVAGSTYPIVITPGTATGAGGFVATNYIITYVNGALVVTPAPLTLQANDATKVYGTTFTPAGTAFTTPVAPVNGETVTSVVETSTGSPPAASVAGSTYPIVITPGSATGAGGFVATNYIITYVDGALTVTPAPLVLTANDATKVYGTTFTPAGTAFTEVGLVNSDTVTSVAETSTGSAPTASVAGSTYPIVITPGSASGSFTPGNYTIAYVDGKLTVTPAPLTIKANDATKAFGETFTPSSTAFTTPVAPQNGETVGSVTALSPTGTPPTAVAPGPYPITPSAATGGTFTPGNYTITYVDGALTVTPVVPPVVVPPVEPPVVFVPPVEPPVVVVPPVEPPVVVVPPEVVTPPDVEAPPELPYEGPVVPPRVRPPTWVPVVVPPLLPPQLATVVPPAPPAPVMVRIPEPVPAPVLAPEPVLEQPPVAPSPVYVAPLRPRKQDRN